MKTNSHASLDTEFGIPAVVRHGAFDLIIVAAFFVFSWGAVSLAYGHRFYPLVWAAITLLATGMPAYVGFGRKRTSELTVWLAMLLSIACPIAYIATGSNEQMRDTIFLGVGCTVLFVSSGWMTYFLLAGKRLQAWLIGALSVCSMIAVIAMTTIYMFLV